MLHQYKIKTNKIYPKDSISSSLAFSTPENVFNMTKKRKSQEIAQQRSHDDPQEDPDVVGHDAQHQHVSQDHLHNMQDGLQDVKKPSVHSGGAASCGGCILSRSQRDL